MSFITRPMASKDLDGVLAIALDQQAPRWTRLDYLSILRSEPSELLMRQGVVAVRDGLLAGFAVISWLRHESAAEIEGLFVDRMHRRQGLGSGLVAACGAWAAAAGATALRLEVRASNTAALTLYQLLGFAPVGIRRAYYSLPVEDAVLLQATLPL